MVKARPLAEWHEDYGPVLWWKFPLVEAPYVGTPLDTGLAVEIEVRYYGPLLPGMRKAPGLEVGLHRNTVRHFVGGWPGYHTHWTPLPEVPVEGE